MVDNVTANSGLSINDKASLLELNTRNVADVNQQAAESSASVSSLKEYSFQDNATLSDEAKNRFNQEKEVLKFSRLAQRVDDGTNPSKVSLLKDLVNSGRINDYLRGINNEDLAQKIIDSPFGSYLSK
ncbi:MAG: hypothetical protein K2X66_18730 [Cyanobacteria bacterium]|nr:hypothetical protein [Cyanobacteriota bacterium]